MDCVIDHDLHLHSGLSLCSLDPEQTPQRLLQYAIENGYRQICLTDHFYDERAPHPAYAGSDYDKQNSAYICRSLPLPQDDRVQFLFGGETDMDMYDHIGISEAFLQQLDFLIVPINHLHVRDFTIDSRLITPVNWQIPGTEESCRILSVLWVRRLRAVLEADLPFGKVGLAHLQWFNFADERYMAHTLDLIPDVMLRELFCRVAELGAGVELNFIDRAMTPQVSASVYRIFETAKACGCKFYFGSDAHHPAELAGAKANFTAIAARLGLTEADKFHIAGV